MDKKIQILGVIALFVSASTHAQPVIVTMDKFVTEDQMLLANEINESGEPFAEALGYDLSLLDPFIPNSPDVTAYTLGIENYEYSRYQLGTIITRSGMGLHMMWAPVIKRMASMEGDGFDGSMTGMPNGFNEDDELIKNIKMFSKLSNQAPPGNPWPQFADFISGDPYLPQAIDPVNFAWNDFSTLRWDRSKMKKMLSPGAMGQSLMKQYLWASDMLSAFHDMDDNGIDANGTNTPDFPDSALFNPDNNIYFGGNALDGFIGMVITAEAINKIAFLTGALAYDGTSLGAINLASYQPGNGIQYFPHTIKVTEAKVHPNLPPKPSTLRVIDKRSYLFDQVSMLWATSSFANMMNPENNSDAAHYAYHEVFDGQPFPGALSQTGNPGPFDLMKGTSRAIFLNMMAMHFNKQHMTFVDQAKLSAKGVKQGNEISTEGAAYAIVALESMLNEFAGTPLEPMAMMALKAQATYIASKLHDGKGGFASRQQLRSDNPVKVTTISGQAAAMRGLYTAYRVTGNKDFLNAANLGYHYLIKHFYVANEHAFQTKLHDNEAKYTPRNFALIAGALREATLTGGIVQAADIYVDFFKKVGNKMQLSEGAASGEIGNDSDKDGIVYIPEQMDNLPPVFASDANINLSHK